MRRLLLALAVAGGVLFYPMLVSIYVFLPLFIGFFGYIFVRGFDEGRWVSVTVASLYFLNLEVNLSLPYLLTHTIALMIYLFFYPKFVLFKQCKWCKIVAVIALMNGLYWSALMLYDMALGGESIVLDTMLFYSFLIDLIAVIVL